jgi:hypothetical protein
MEIADLISVSLQKKVNGVSCWLNLTITFGLTLSMTLHIYTRLS